jgi:phospholipase C
VPAIIVSPWVKPGRPCHDVFEHTSIIKTILERFGDDEAIEHMGARVWSARNVWHMLTESEPRECAPVADAGAAALSSADLRSRQLKWPAATLQRTIQLIDHERHDELPELQQQLLLIYEQLRRTAPRPIARAFSRLARRLPLFLTRIGRFLTRPLVSRLPPTSRPMPDRMP